MTEAYLLGGVRTPFARYGGSLSHLRLDDLLGLSLAGACERVGVDRDQIEDIMAGKAPRPPKDWSPAAPRSPGATPPVNPDGAHVTV